AFSLSCVITFKRGVGTSSPDGNRPPSLIIEKDWDYSARYDAIGERANQSMWGRRHAASYRDCHVDVWANCRAHRAAVIKPRAGGARCGAGRGAGGRR